MDELDQALAQCSAADRWTPSCAARWWREHAQESLEPFLLVCANSYDPSPQ
jgi:hypothetical protein